MANELVVAGRYGCHVPSATSLDDVLAALHPPVTLAPGSHPALTLDESGQVVGLNVALLAADLPSSTDDQNALEVPIVEPLDGIFPGVATVGAVIEEIDNWSKAVINAEVALPITAFSPVEQGPVYLMTPQGQFQVAETNDILPRLRADGVMHWHIRRYAARATISAHVLIPAGNPFAGSLVPFDTVLYDRIGGRFAGGGYVAPVDGEYRVTFSAHQTNQAGGDNNWTALAGFVGSFAAAELFVNGVYYATPKHDNIFADGELSWGHTSHFSDTVSVLAGDTITVQYRHSAGTDKALYAHPGLTYLAVELVR